MGIRYAHVKHCHSLMTLCNTLLEGLCHSSTYLIKGLKLRKESLSSAGRRPLLQSDSVYFVALSFISILDLHACSSLGKYYIGRKQCVYMSLVQPLDAICIAAFCLTRTYSVMHIYLSIAIPYDQYSTLINNIGCTVLHEVNRAEARPYPRGPKFLCRVWKRSRSQLWCALAEL